MNTELQLKHTRASSNKHGKRAKDISFIDFVKILTCQKQHQEAMFRASKQHATGTYHGKQKHGMILVNAWSKRLLLNMGQNGTETYHGKQSHGVILLEALNKTPLLNMSHKGTEDMMGPMKTYQVL